MGVKKGGPKKKNGQRDNRGRLIPELDQGTPELLYKKLLITGSSREEMSNLGVLRGRGIINDDQYEAGIDFERCYRAYIGRPTPAGGAFDLRSPGEDYIPEATLERHKTRYWNCLAALMDVSSYTFNLVRDMCLFERSGGLIAQIIASDIRFVSDEKNGHLICGRLAGGISPDIRHKISILSRGLEVLKDVPYGDYSREAEQLMRAIKARSEGECS